MYSIEILLKISFISLLSSALLPDGEATGCARPPLNDPYAVILVPDQDVYNNQYDVVRLTCAEGTTAFGEDEYQCNPDNQWHPDWTDFYCLAQCSGSDFDDDIIVFLVNDTGRRQQSFNDAGNFNHGETVPLACGIPGEFLGNPYSSCSNGTFDDTSQSCAVYCPPPFIDNGVQFQPGPNTDYSGIPYYLHGTVIQFSCQNADDDVYCGAENCDTVCQDGVWTPHPTPSCGVPSTTTEIPSSDAEVLCDSTTMTLILSRHLLAPDEDGTDVHFIDDSCVGYNHDSEHIAITTRYDLCSTKQEQLDEDMVYSNVVTYYRPRPEADDAKQVITREHYLRIPVKCILERKQLLSEMFTPQLGEVTFEEVGFGEFTLTLQRYEDEKFDIVANDSALIPLGTEIFFGVELTSVSGLTLFIDSCWATPSTDPLDTLKYVLFEEGCAKDQTVRFYNNLGTLTLKGFQVDAFAFLGDYSQVFVHCSVLVCDAEDSGSRCLQGCMSRRRRGLGGTGSQSTPHTISLGPFYEDHSPNHAENNAAEAVGRYPSTATVATMGSVGIVIALVALLVVMVNRAFRNRPGSLGYRQVTFEPTSLE